MQDLHTAAYERFKTRLAAGEEEQVPAAVADRLIDGENPVRVWRTYRGLSIKELAGIAGVSSAYVSQIEAGQREGSVATMKKIAHALNLQIDDIV